MDKRKILYYLPLISTTEVIEFSEFKIKPFSEEANYSSLLPKDIFSRNGSLIEVNGFTSGEHYSGEVDKKIFKAIEKIKFGYFFSNPSHIGNIFGYISNETFECFRILEKNEDPSFEQKVRLSNGMFNFSESLETYYKSRTSIKQKQLHVKSDFFIYADYLSEKIEDEKLLNLISLYNRCWSTYSIHNSIDKPVLARVSIERLAKIQYGEEYGLRKFIDEFFNGSFTILEELSKSSATIKKINDFILPSQDKLKVEVTKHLEAIREARHSFAHSGIETEELTNMPFYLVWFPLFWMISLHSNKIKEAEGIRLALFFCLMNFDPQDWQKIKFSMLPNKTKKTHIQIYSDNSRLLPIYLKRDEDGKELSEAVLLGIFKWIKNE